MSALLFCFFSLALFAYNNWQPAHEVDSSAYLMVGHATLPHITLGYSWFIGLVTYLCNHLSIIVLFQIVLSLLCLFFIYRIALRCFGITVARVASLLWAINLGFIIYTQYILTEILLACLLLLFFERFLFFLRYPTYAPLITSGLALGVSIIVKPAALFLPVVLLPLFLGQRNRVNVKAIALFLCSFALPVVSYMGHNYACFDSFSLSSLARDNIYYYFLPQLRARVEQTSYENQRDYCMSLHSSELRSLFITTVATYPLQACLVWARNMVKSLLGLYTTQLKVFFDRSINGRQCSFFAQSGSFLTRIMSYIQCGTDLKLLHGIGCFEALYTISRLFIMLGAVCVLWYQAQWLLVYFFVVVPLYFIAITGHDGCGRFRLMVEGLCIVLTAYGFVLIFRWFQCYVWRRDGQTRY